MDSLNLKNGKERLYFEFIIAESLLQYPKAENSEQFLHLLAFNNHDRSHALGELHNEIEDNLLLLTNKDSRIAYLSRIVLRINNSKYVLEKHIDSWLSQPDEQYHYVVNYPGEPQRSFFEPTRTMIHHLKSGLVYLELGNRIVQQFIDIDSDKVDKEADVLNYSLPEVEKVQHKFVLLHTLGIIDFLKEEDMFKNLNQTNQASLISKILGLEEKSAETIRGCLKYYQTLKHKNCPITQTAINKVNALLAELGWK